MCLVLSRCGFDLAAAEWSYSCTESLTSQLLSPRLFFTLSFLFVCFPPPSRVSLTSNLRSSAQSNPQMSLSWFMCFLCLTLFFISPLLPFFSAGVRAGNAVSLLHLHLHVSGKETGGEVWALKKKIHFTPTGAHQHSNAVVMYCIKIAQFN